MPTIDALEAALDAAQQRHADLFSAVALYATARQRYPLATDAQVEAIRVAHIGACVAFRRFAAAKFGIDPPLGEHLAAIKALTTEEYREYRAVHG
jgi:hypothetical protein